MLPEPEQYPSALEDLRHLFDELTRIRGDVAEKIIAISSKEGIPNVRETIMVSAITAGTAGIPEPEVPGVGHLLAMSPTRAELVSLLQHLTAMNQQTMAMRGEPTVQDDRDILHEREVEFVVTRNETVVLRAIEIVDELSRYFPTR